MYILKIKHGFAKLIYLFPLIFVYCLHSCIGQDDFDYRESYLLRSGGDIPEYGNFINSINTRNTKNIMTENINIFVLTMFSFTLQFRTFSAYWSSPSSTRHMCSLWSNLWGRNLHIKGNFYRSILLQIRMFALYKSTTFKVTKGCSFTF